MRLIAYFLPIFALGLVVSLSSSVWTIIDRASLQTSTVKQEIDQLFKATNDVRIAKGSPPLQQDAKLMRAAQQYADLMAAQEDLSHTIGGLSLTEKAQKVGYAYRSLSENIASNTDLDGQFVVYQQWMRSKGHRKNLLATNVGQIGIGIAGPSRRTRLYYYCQIFGAPLSTTR